MSQERNVSKSGSRGAVLGDGKVRIFWRHLSSFGLRFEERI